MKKIFCLGSLLLLFLSVNANAQEKSTNIQIQITDENGKVIKKEYKSREAMENDPELKAMGVDVDVKGSGISVRNKEGIQRISITQEDGSNRMVIRQHGSGFGPDSMEVPVPPTPPQPPLGMEEVVEERMRMMEMRDSLLSLHLEEREAHMEEARLHREKMLIQMDERRAEMRHRMEERGKGMERDPQMITIENLSEKDAARLGIKQQILQVRDLQISPKPMEETLKLGFITKSKTPVQIKLSNQDNILLLNETENLSGKSFEKTYELNSFGRGTYFLQIIQDRNILARRIVVE